MQWNDFYKSVKEGRYQSVYLFTGPEEWNKKEALATLRRTILPAGLEQLNDVTLENCSAQAIIDSAETMPVMCERRIVVVRDWAPLTSGKAKNEEADVERMQAWLNDVPDTCILVFYMTVEINGTKKLTKQLKKTEGYIEFDHLSGALLQKWCNQQLKPYGKKITPDALNEMTMMAGQDLNRLNGELTKLAAYTQDAAQITADDVRAVVAPSPEYSVFMILDHLLLGKTAEAIKVVNNVLQSDPYPARLIALLASQLRINAHMKFALESTGNTLEVQKTLGINEYRAKHILRQIRNIPASAFQERYQWCVETDFDIRSGRIRERAALDALLLKISLPRRGTK